MADDKFYIVNEQRAQENYGQFFIRMRVFLEERLAVFDCFRRNFDMWKSCLKLCGFSLWPDEARFRAELDEDAREMVDIIAEAVLNDTPLTFDLDHMCMYKAKEIDKYFAACLRDKEDSYRYYTVEEKIFEPTSDDATTTTTTTKRTRTAV